MDNLEQMQEYIENLKQRKRSIAKKLTGVADSMQKPLTDDLEQRYPGLRRDAYHGLISVGGEVLDIDGKAHPIIHTGYINSLERAVRNKDIEKWDNPLRNFLNILAHEYGHVLEEESIWPQVEEKIGDKHLLFKISPLFISEGFAHWFGNYFSNYNRRVSERTFDHYVPMLDSAEAMDVFSTFKKEYGITHINPKQKPSLDNFQETFIELSKKYKK